MRRPLEGHGCLFLAVCVCSPGIVHAQEHARIQSLVFDIEYAVSEEALPLTSVQLWYRVDGDGTWSKFGIDEDRQSPIPFRASREGEYEFFLVAINGTGASSASPTSTTPAHVKTFVDCTPPVVQLHPLQPTMMLGQRVVQIRWTAIDAHFGARPIAIEYQQPPDETWHPVTSDPIANTGRYDWRVPDSLSGPAAVRLAVTDRGGHQVHSKRQVLEVVAAHPIQPSNTAMTVARASMGASEAETTALPGSARAMERARRLYAEAMAHGEHGEYREGIARLRRAIKLDPHWAEAFAAMADMLYGIGDLDRALSAYELALKQKPTMREALRGAARIHRKRNDHAAAATALRTILRYNPNDAEVWVNLGDIAVYQGDEVLARECYTRATRIDPDASEVIADARKRLELMTEVSRQYRTAPH